MNMSTFHTDLKQGKATEDKVEAILREGGLKVYPGSGDAAYDRLVMADKRAHLVEIKDESHYENSPCICVELSAGVEKRPAGLFKTEANIEIHYFGKRCVVFKTRPMMLFVLRALETKKLEIKQFEGGDNGVRGVLIPTTMLAGVEWAEVLPSEKLARCRLWGSKKEDDMFGGVL